jgi:benzoyl-CoA reductase/2-hydroxyglutaryl-CoA dehydratase subunit BcrC/BadD/HgdB
MTEARQIDYREWHSLFRQIPAIDVESTRYYRHLKDATWSQYLFPPSTHAVYGNRLLRKLKFDNSPASLRLWGFVLSESERIYRARQAGMKVIAPMGDLGAVTPLIYSFPNTVAFYPDCLWWTPFLMESRVLFDDAAKLGLGEDCCFVRASLGAFLKRAYFPQPNLCIGTTGASCDDMAAVMSEVEGLGIPIHYFELPHRHDDVDKTKLQDFLSGQYQILCKKLEEKVGSTFSTKAFRDATQKVNRLRVLIGQIKSLVATQGHNPMGAVEMMNVEFAALSYYGDLDECILVLQEFHNLVKARVEAGFGYPEQNLRIVWITPPADPILMNYVEELGGRVVGSEYLINQSTPHIKVEDDPFQSLAEVHLSGSLMGSTAHRVDLVLEQLEKTRADGAIISGVFGSSHCPYETLPIVEALRSRSIPVLAFDVVAPGKMRLQSQIYNRIEAFMESLKARRRRRAG